MMGYWYSGRDPIDLIALADVAFLKNYLFFFNDFIVILSFQIISGHKDEFETDFDRGGETRAHAMLVKTAGVRYLVVLINKMDDPTVNWDQKRYDEIRDHLTLYLEKCGFKSGGDIVFMPYSGMSGAFLKKYPSEQPVPWHK